MRTRLHPQPTNNANYGKVFYLYDIILYRTFQGGKKMEAKLKMIYWKGDKFWVGKLLEHPDIMTQGETIEELMENMKDAYMLMALEDVPDNHEVKELAISL